MLVLNQDEVRQLLSMDAAIEATTQAYINAVNVLTYRCGTIFVFRPSRPTCWLCRAWWGTKELLG